MPNPKLSDRQKLILFVALVAALGIVAAVNWAGRRSADLYGPTALAQASDGRVWLVLNQELQVLDRYGTSIRRVSPKALGILPPIAALAPAADGAMVVGSRETGLLHVVDANGGLRATIDPAAGGNKRLFGAFHLLPLPGTQDWVIADTSNHRLLRLGKDGRVLRSYGSTDGRPGALHFPNGLAFDAEERFLLVDTNHHTVRAFTPLLEPLPDAGFIARADGGYVWPALIGVAPDDVRFVSIMADGMERGRVFKLSREGKRLAELTLPASADPSGLLVRPTDVLVSDQFGLAIHRYGLDGSHLGTFGDDSLQAAYREIGQLRRLYRMTIAGGQVLLIGLLAVLLLLLRRERRTQERLGATLAAQVSEHAKPGALRLFGYSFWLVLRVSFALLALNVIANLVLGHFTRLPAVWTLFAADGLIFLLLVVAPCALGVWHFDRMLNAGKYSGILNFAAQTLLRRLGAKLEGLMQPDEPIEQLALAATILGRVRLLVLTPRRFLVLTLRANLRDLSRAQEILRIAVSKASSRNRNVPYVQRLAGRLGTASLEIEIGGARHVFPVIDPLAARELARRLSSTGKGAGAGVAHLRDVPAGRASVERGDAGVVMPLLLSAILPGLGQLRQQRLGMGTITFLCVASWVLQMMGPLIAMARRTAEVHPLLPVIAVSGYAFIWSVSLLDTYLAARAGR